MIVIKRTVEPRTFVPSSQSQEENPLRVFVSDLSPRREAEIRDATINMTFKDIEGGKTSPLINISSQTVNYHLVAHSLAGWENVSVEDSSGTTKEFRFSKNMSDIDLFISGLPRDIRRELFEFVLGDSVASEE